MNRFALLLAMSAITLSLAACGNNAGDQEAASQAGMGTETEDGAINNVIDCAQYPSADAQRYADEYLPECQQFTTSMGYRDGVVLPMDTAAQEVKLASDPLTCPKVNPGNIGYYCIGLDKSSK